ncbi:hypothetical protein PsAD2_04611 [Pseudovibrio axinellae]|uniref:Uncharacterized protein n=1 Tax=Pseudovibrio axinellae TaxID=989403 RepID=A0A165SVK2_9HYPH|nr:hypothetical protein [Pseudovibrio axinellae]KZL04528.1 hypothetical protein PsAD2_04611 [Pseudovibrio axinellae]SEQ74264.1 hypothetical protein SAMN05421798_10497 [Pseudovibrio axinellae]
MDGQEQTVNGWQLDRRVPAALIITVMLQFVGFVWWAASVNERVTALERDLADSSVMVERVTRVETRVDSIYWQLEKIDGKIDRIAEIN